MAYHDKAMHFLPVEKTDQEVVAMALKDTSWFGEIVARYEDKLNRYIERLGVRNAEDRQDVLQEIFIKVYKNLNGFDTSLKFSSWIYRIAHNESISWFRKKNVRPEGHLIAEGENVLNLISAGEDDAGIVFDKTINAQVVDRALAEVSEKYRDPLILRFFEHKEYEEISDILKIPIGSVGTLIHRGKHQLKELIDKEQIRI